MALPLTEVARIRDGYETPSPCDVLQPIKCECGKTIGEMVEERPVTVWRCPKCDHVIAKVRLDDSSYVQIKCLKCGNITEKGDR